MPLHPHLKKTLTATAITLSLIAATYSSKARNRHNAAENNTISAHHSNLPADSTAWVDSLKKVINKKYTWGYGGNAVINSQKRYISANNTLAAYYANKFYAGDYASLASAEKYYWNVASLTDGTDGDIADEASVIKLRNDGAKKLMRLYLSLKPAPVYRQKLYKLVRGNWGVLGSETASTRDKVSKYIFKSTNRFFFDTAQVVGEPGRGVTGYVNAVYHYNSKPGAAAISLFDKFAEAMVTNPVLRLKVEATSGKPTMLDQQLLWEVANYAITYLVEKKGISADRFLFFTNMDNAADTKYMGLDNVPVLKLTFAAEGEEGPSMVPPPMPNLKHD